MNKHIQKTREEILSQLGTLKPFKPQSNPFLSKCRDKREISTPVESEFFHTKNGGILALCHFSQARRPNPIFDLTRINPTKDESLVSYARVWNTKKEFQDHCTVIKLWRQIPSQRTLLKENSGLYLSMKEMGIQAMDQLT